MNKRTLTKVIIIGRVGEDLEMNYTPTGKAITSFSLAVEQVTVAPDGQVSEGTEWFHALVGDNLARTCNPFLRKGKNVYVEGRLQVRKWIDANGTEQKVIEIVAGEVMLLESQSDAQTTMAGAWRHDCWISPIGLPEEEEEE